MMLEIEEHEFDKRINVRLAETEAAVLAAASRIYAAYIAEGSAKGNEKQLMKQAINEAVLMANHIDDMIKAEDEL